MDRCWINVSLVRGSGVNLGVVHGFNLSLLDVPTEARRGSDVRVTVVDLDGERTTKGRHVPADVLAETEGGQNAVHNDAVPVGGVIAPLDPDAVVIDPNVKTSFAGRGADENVGDKTLVGIELDDEVEPDSRVHEVGVGLEPIEPNVMHFPGHLHPL
jgi:hypothetical protein